MASNPFSDVVSQVQQSPQNQRTEKLIDGISQHREAKTIRPTSRGANFPTCRFNTRSLAAGFRCLSLAPCGTNTGIASLPI